jgi:uncharacterized protein YeaO (DUF488 family)
MGQVRIKRIYEPAEPGEGRRVLVDRLWPRGVSKSGAPFDEWRKEVAPSTELRRWYGHVPERFPEFTKRYRAELSGGEPARAMDDLARAARSGTVTLVTATKDVERSAARVLADTIERRLRTARTRGPGSPKRSGR